MIEGEDFEVLEYGAEVSEDLKILAEFNEAAVLSSIRNLIVMEIEDHLMVRHDCKPGCQSKGVVEAVLAASQDQLQWTALRMVKLLAVKYLKDMEEMP